MTKDISYRPRDAFLDSREEVAKADQPGMEIDVPSFDLGVDDHRTDLPYAEVFPRWVAGPTLLADTPAPVNPAPQTRGQGGDVKTEWSTGVGSVMLGSTGDWLHKGSAEAAPRAPSVIAAMTALAPRVDTLPSLEKAHAGDAAMPFTGDWLGLNHEAAREVSPLPLPGSDLSDAELYPHSGSSVGLEKAARRPARLAHSLTGV